MINNKRSYTEYNVTSPTTDFAIGFDNYSEETKNEILVTLNNAPVQAQGYTVQRINEQVIRITPAIEIGVVRLQRVTYIDAPFHQFTAGALFTAASVDENFNQVRQSQQEVSDKFIKLEDDIGFTNLEATVEAVNSLYIATQSVSDAAELSASASNISAISAENSKSVVEGILVDVSNATSEVYTALSVQSDFVDSVVSAVSGGGKAYKTLAEAEADLPNVPINFIIEVTNDDANNGRYQWDGVVLTPSDYDPVAEAQVYTDMKTETKLEGVSGKNLFDKSKIEVGKGLADTGTTITAAGRNVSGYIPVKPNTAYSFSNTNKATFYDTNKVFVQLAPASAANVTSASTAAFVRIDVSDANLNTAQIELGVNKTVYEPYKIELPPSTVGTTSLKTSSVTSDKLQPFAVQSKHLADAVFLNMHDPSKLVKGIGISFTDGKTETINAAYDVTEYIACQPSTQYAASTFTRVFFYDKNGNFLSIASTVTTFTTPANCYQMRFQISDLVSGRFQLNIGTTPTATQQPYKYKLPQLTIEQQTKAQIDAITARKYSFSDAWIAWRDGQKFPICFLGDSTTNGNGTTGYVARTTPYTFGVDYVAPNSYAKLFQDLIREASGNSVMRAYNAGYSGQNSGFALTNIDNIMSGDYADTKMMGISHGINDRTTAPKLYADLFESRIEGLIQWCFGKGITPFLMTTQPMTIPSQVGTTNASGAEEIANSIKRKLASKYNLEIIDINKFGQQFMQYSSKPLLNDIMEAGNSVIHFGNGGHKFTAELIFANFCKRTLWTYNDGEQLDYTTQLLASDIDQTELNQLSTFKQGFKNEVLRTQDNATNKLYQDFYVFNAGRKQLDLTAYYANAAVGQYAVVDDVQTTITTQGQALGTLDLGLHKIKAYSSATTALDWLGFKLTPTS